MADEWVASITTPTPSSPTHRHPHNPLTCPLRHELGDLLRVHVGGVHGEAVAALNLIRLRPVLARARRARRARHPDGGRDL